MKRSTIVLSALGVLLYLGGLPLFAQHGRGGTHGGGAAGSHGATGSHDGSPSTTNSTTPAAAASGKNATEHLQDNTKLSAKLLSILQKQNPTMTAAQLQTAAGNFRNLGQFMAAVHASENLGIPFDKLEAAMTGKPAMSLGRAIATLDPQADTKTEVKKAHKQASDDLKETQTQS